jgi:hypothetical protein
VNRRRVLGIGAVACSAVLPDVRAAELVTEVLAVSYRRAEELVDVLRTLVPPPGSVSAIQNQLVVRTTPSNLREVRRVLANLDRAPANLLISVKRSLDEAVRRDLASARARVRVGDVGVAVGGGAARAGSAGRAGGDDAAAIRLQRSTASRRDDDLQTVRVLEGREAYIHFGQSLPVPVKEHSKLFGSGTSVREGVRYESFGRGFSVRPRLSGNRVTLHVSPGRRELRLDGRVDVQRASTVVSGELGRWMQIAGAANDGSAREQRIGSTRSTDHRRDDAIYVKVDRLD